MKFGRVFIGMGGLVLLAIGAVRAQEDEGVFVDSSWDGTVSPVWRVNLNAINNSEASASLDNVVDFTHSVGTDLSQCSDCHLVSPDVALTSVMGAHGSAIRGFTLGDVVVRGLTDQILRTHLKMEDEPALVVIANKDDEEAPLRVGDVIVRVDGEPIENAIKLRLRMAETQEDVVKVSGIRQGSSFEVLVPAISLASPAKPFRIGVQLESPSDALRSQLRLYEGEGLLVTQVLEDSPAQKAGIQLHDILLRADNERLSNLETLRQVLKRTSGAPTGLIIMRGGKEQKMVVLPEQEKAEVEARLDICPAVNLNTSNDIHLTWPFVYQLGLDNEAAAARFLDLSLSFDESRQLEDEESEEQGSDEEGKEDE